MDGGEIPRFLFWIAYFQKYTSSGLAGGGRLVFKRGAQSV